MKLSASAKQQGSSYQTVWRTWRRGELPVHQLPSGTVIVEVPPTPETRLPKVFLVTADGVVVANPRHYRTAEQQLARAQRRVSRRKKGSKRRRKAVALLKRKHQTVQRQRRDFHHKTALALLQQYDTISLEDLRVANLVRNDSLAKCISAAGWAAFRTILEGHGSMRRASGARGPARLHQPGLQRGVAQWEPLSLHTAGGQEPVSPHPCLHVCPSCGLVLDRDENAAQHSRRTGPSGANVARWGSVA
jgi:putative transposase